MRQQPTPNTAPRKETTRKEKEAARAVEDKLDQSLEDSFPASDPPSMTRAPADKSSTKFPPPTGASRKTPARDDLKRH
ncbi:hypothetical protein [Chelatococcus asaccharovorans]|jgi:hypothetical protein|uniref:Uncharacterized protein n=1 Tax=Chelatococcus asaccharovorans TaxID=28210 RepID=A0A2V3U6C7_9HYPH|nr:hypothetical protein [Chelatococcus asaccharovorans]MBS7703892.1 hypothetical protein [Chelatococcus asaccharovorans]PXW58054.1 hypothetical protein C7450_106230 [Chelatococcus asaccharovorans]CAH1667893.1 conserved hypothetical protein [Chelatococcus asaccharovorans]CAH1680585.1 conserved hypothetical protein [Chelatococcus asaccharovorans]